MYKTKETAIKHIKNGDDFWTKPFELFRDDKDVVLAAVKKNGHALEHASAELRADKEVVLAAMNQNGYYLKFASKELQGDKEVVLAAIQTGQMPLKFASNELKSDKEVVLAALKKDGRALRFASAELRADKEVVLQAVKETYSSKCGYIYLSIIVERASTDIQELCKGKDPVQALEAAIRMEKFQADLKPKPPSQKRGLKI